jgi:hypothetical protein
MRFASRTFRRKISRKARTRRLKQKRQRTRRQRGSKKMKGGSIVKKANQYPDPYNSTPKESFSTQPQHTESDLMFQEEVSEV